MKHLKLIILVGILSLGVIVFAFLSFQKTPVEKSPLAQEEWEEKSDERLPVSIKVKPVQMGGNVASWEFLITLDTHSVELNEDLLQAVILTDDQGNSIQPIAWEGAPPGGHHREGSLIFEPTTSTPQWVELKIQNIGGIPERSFKWEFNKASN